MTPELSDPVIAGKKYRIARNKEGDLLYQEETRKTQAPQEKEWEIVINDWSGGMGLARLLAGQGYTKRFYYSKNFDSITPGILRPSPAPKSLAVTEDARGGIRSAFEDLDGTTPVLYILYKSDVDNEARVLKINISGAPSIDQEITIGSASDAPGQAIKAYAEGQVFQADTFQANAFATSIPAATRWYVPVNNGDRLARLTTIAAGADVWDIIETVLGGAIHFSRSGRRIWRGHTVSLISAFAIGPTNDIESDANWGADTPVGQSDLAITGLTALGRDTLVGKREGLFGADEEAELVEMLPELPPDPASKYARGWGTAVWHSRIYYPASRQGLQRHDLVGWLPAGPDAMPENTGDEPNLSDQIRRGSHAGLWPVSDWLWGIYSSSTQGMYILVGRERGRGDEAENEIIWHPFLFIADTGHANGTEGESIPVVSWRGLNPILWWWRRNQGTTINFLDLADDGSPYRPNSDRGTAQTSEMFQSSYDMGVPGTLKYIREAEIILQNGTPNAEWQPAYRIDGSTRVTVGAVVTASGPTTRFVTPRVNDAFREIRPEIVCTITGALADERVHARAMILRGGYLPDTGKVIHYTFDVSEGVLDSEGVPDERPVEAKISTLEALVMGSVRQITDHRGQVREVVIEDVHEVDPQTMGAIPEQSLLSVTLTEVEYA